MITAAQKIQLQSIAYRQLDAAKWAKPIGYGLALIEIDQARFSIMFQGVNGDPHCWNSTDLDFTEQSESLSNQVLSAERYNLHGCEIGDYVTADFAFLTLEQQIEAVLQ
jgi:hypothetical protein